MTPALEIMNFFLFFGASNTRQSLSSPAWQSFSSNRVSPAAGSARVDGPCQLPEVTRWEGSGAVLGPVCGRGAGAVPAPCHAPTFPTGLLGPALLTATRRRAPAAFQTSFSLLLWIALSAGCNENSSFVTSY